MIGIALGFVGAGVRAGRFMVGVSLLPARTAWDAAWPRLQARGEAVFDDALAGPLTEHFARSIGEHRVIERAADELIANGTVTALFDQALQAGLAEQIADRLLAPDVLDSRLLLEITDRVMASDEMQRVIAHIECNNVTVLTLLTSADANAPIANTPYPTPRRALQLKEIEKSEWQ